MNLTINATSLLNNISEFQPITLYNWIGMTLFLLFFFLLFGLLFKNDHGDRYLGMRGIWAFIILMWFMLTIYYFALQPLVIGLFS